MYNVKLFEDNNFFNFKLSVKSSDVFLAIKSYEILSGQSCDYPLHLGITEAGGLNYWEYKILNRYRTFFDERYWRYHKSFSSADPEEEIKAGYDILKSLNLRSRGIKIISCPSCARQAFPVIETVKVLEEKFLT